MNPARKVLLATQQHHREVNMALQPLSARSRSSPAFSTGFFDTRSVAAHDRIDFWEERCTENVVGLQCSSLEPEGFQARFQYVNFGALKIVDIAGKQHVVNRAPDLVRTREKDSVFLILLLHGTAFINRANECTLLNAGDCVIYDTNSAYMHGFPSSMRHIIFDVPGAEFRARFPGWQLREALRYDAALGSGRILANGLRQSLLRRDPFQKEGPDPAIVDDVWQALESAYSICRGCERSSSHTQTLLRVKDIISRRLSDQDLSPEVIAGAAAISVRQLNRLFGSEEHTVSETILVMRLNRARDELVRHGSGVSIAEIAYRWGFRSPSHFSRSFRERFGCSPSELRHAEH